MLKIENNNIYLTKGDTAAIKLTILKPDGSEYEIEEHDRLVFNVGYVYENEPVITQIFNGNKLILTPEETEKLQFGDYHYEVKLIKSTLTDTIICEGIFRVGRGFMVYE